MRGRAPAWLPASALTDLRQLAAGLRPAVRLSIGRRTTELRRWARLQGYFTASDDEGYVVLSRNPAHARRTLRVDRWPGRHTAALGALLGYPPCCSRAAARVGDEGIDRLQAGVAGGAFIGLFTLIDPSGYLSGRALISHVPCSRRCVASLAMAVDCATC